MKYALIITRIDACGEPMEEPFCKFAETKQELATLKKHYDEQRYTSTDEDGLTLELGHVYAVQPMQEIEV